jgi:hypothetical protein
VDEAFAFNKQLLPKERVLETMAYVREGGSASAIREAVQGFWDKLPEVKVLAEEQTKQLLACLDNVLGSESAASVQEATRILWDMHHPYMVWYYLGVVGLVGTLGMILFYFATRKLRPGESAEPVES